MNRALLACAVTLTACTTTTDIVPAGPDTYVLSAANEDCPGCTSPQHRATKQASEYCSKMGKTMTVRDYQEQTFDTGKGKRYTLIFTCVARK